MNTFELLSQLAEKPKEEIIFSLKYLMTTGKIDFLDLNKSYVEYLEDYNKDQGNKLSEANTCVMDMMFLHRRKKKVSETENRAIQRGLYLLNSSNMFNMGNINKELNYIGDEKAKELSWYERNKNRNV